MEMEEKRNQRECKGQESKRGNGIRWKEQIEKEIKGKNRKRKQKEWQGRDRTQQERAVGKRKWLEGKMKSSIWKEGEVKKGKIEYISACGTGGVRTKEQGNDSQRCPEAYVCCVVPTTYAQLSNDKTCWKHSVPCLTRHRSRGHSRVDSVLTHTPHKSIHQVVVMTMSEVAAGELGDRCLWQMVPSAWTSEQHRTSSLSFYRPLLSSLSVSTFSLCHRLSQENPISQKNPFFSLTN